MQKLLLVLCVLTQVALGTTGASSSLITDKDAVPLPAKLAVKVLTLALGQLLP